MDRTITAQDFLYHCWAGLTLTGISEDGYEWMGNDKNWQAYDWLFDGVYDEEEDGGISKVTEYLSA